MSAPEVIIPEGLHVETAADYAKPIPEPPTPEEVAQAEHRSFIERLQSAAGRIALTKLRPRQHPDRCPICHSGDLDACPAPIGTGLVTRQQRRAAERNSPNGRELRAKRPDTRQWRWLRCESCRATVRVTSSA